jgi:nitrate/TMAO reductase-like tetraheme cytochrome c subunit
MGKRFTSGFISFFIFCFNSYCQISPGPLAAVHAKLEGMSNCTQCHEIGNKVTNAKCLACHTELKTRIDQGKGYHSSQDIRAKKCVECHNDHHGVNFQILRFDKDKFNHNLTGFPLVGSHSKRTCKDCHKPEFISNTTIKSKKLTYLGLGTSCLSCHVDYHQNTLSSACTNCHSQDAFHPAPGFNHTSTKFPLVGSHQAVECVKCHPVSTFKGYKFQEFAGIKFANCTNCHQDVHQNKFGQNCRQCHTEVSFHAVKSMTNFDHSKTNFKLEDKHLNVPCASCHKANLTTSLKYALCTDCHQDYHDKQFMTNGVLTDCRACHSVKGFDQFSFTIEQHNQSKFKLEGAHLATPCFTCHKKTDKWNFRNIGLRCIDCHEDIHTNHLDKKYYPESNCLICHNNDTWKTVVFNHSITQFPLKGAHSTISCRSCHFPADSLGKTIQKFSELPIACEGCHKDVHFKQFQQDGLTNCLKCHTFDQWRILNFDHNSTSFKLDGKHQNVPCIKCHKKVTVNNNTFVLYKLKERKCADCH